MKHKHADLIHAWADGAQIQCLSIITGQWENIDMNGKEWYEHYKYRIKPTPKPDWYKFVRVDTTCGHIAKWQSCSPAVANLRLVCDGETGELISAEVI